MSFKLVPNFFCVIAAFIIGVALFKQFNVEQMKFEKPILAVIYSIVIIACIGFMIKKSESK